MLHPLTSLTVAFVGVFASLGCASPTQEVDPLAAPDAFMLPPDGWPTTLDAAAMDLLRWLEPEEKDDLTNSFISDFDTYWENLGCPSAEGLTDAELAKILDWEVDLEYFFDTGGPFGCEVV